MTTNYIGKPINRVDGRAKVTGEAKYAAEYNVPNLTYGFVVSSNIAKGTITKIDASAALGVEGVLYVFTHENRPNLAWFDFKYKDEVSVPGSPFRPLYDNEILYSGQPIALVVAEEFEIARYAASLIRVTYQRKPHQTDLNAKRAEAYELKIRRMDVTLPASPRGNAKQAYEQAAVQHEAEYNHFFEHHNPMEMHASTVVWEGDDKTRSMTNPREHTTAKDISAECSDFPKRMCASSQPTSAGHSGRACVHSTNCSWR